MAWCHQARFLQCLNAFCHTELITCYWPFSLLSDQRNGSEIINSLAPGKFEWNFRYVIFKLISVIDGWGIFCEIALIWMSLDSSDDQSTLVQVMAWCRQATSHYLSQCWPRSLSPYGLTRPQWVLIAVKICLLFQSVQCPMMALYHFHVSKVSNFPRGWNLYWNIWLESPLTWWYHQMETFSALLALCVGNSLVTGKFLSQRPVIRSFDVFFDLWLNKKLSKQSWGWWFETPPSSL